MPGGRPVEWSEDIEAQAYDYIENYDLAGDTIPSVVGLCRVINRARSTVYKWAEEPDKRFSDILRKIHEFQEHALINKGLNGDFNSTITKLILTKHGYSDHSKQEHTGADGKPLAIHISERDSKL
jgi:hypothetical protein